VTSTAITAGPYDRVFRLRAPVAEWSHVHVEIRESGGGSTGTTGSRLTWRALGGIALSPATFLS